MSNPVLSDLTAAVARNTDVVASGILLINGIAGKLQAAVDAALLNGATAAELEPVTGLVSALNVKSDELAAAVAANT